MATRGEHRYIHHTFPGAPAGRSDRQPSKQTDAKSLPSTPHPNRTRQDINGTHTASAFLLFLRLLCLHSSASAMVRSLLRSEADGDRIGKSREIRNEQRSAPQQVRLDNSGATLLRARLARSRHVLGTSSQQRVGRQREAKQSNHLDIMVGRTEGKVILPRYCTHSRAV
jgi:hypothetical protein